MNLKEAFNFCHARLTEITDDYFGPAPTMTITGLKEHRSNDV